MEEDSIFNTLFWENCIAKSKERKETVPSYIKYKKIIQNIIKTWM